MWLLLEHARGRTDSFIAEIERLLDSDFPHRHSKDALNELYEVFAEESAILNSFTSDSRLEIVKQQCGLTLQKLYAYSPLLGFILRSTNVRNAFEVVGPFLRLTRQVLDAGQSVAANQTRLLFSSEWDYSPFTYPAIPDLPGYLFIGLPAPESGNPLLVPLAAHELGHSAWIRNGLEAEYRPLAKAEIVKLIEARWIDYTELFRPRATLKPADLTTDLFALESWSLAFNLCLKQAEETLCDCLGLRLFGTSYLHAFAYLLSPGFERRSVGYPSTQARIANLLNAAASYDVGAPDQYEELFGTDKAVDLVRSDEFQLAIADGALKALVPAIIARAAEIAETAKLPVASAGEEDRILKRFSKGVPAEHCKTIVDIVNAGWRAMLGTDTLEQLPVKPDRRGAVLKELLLKNFEVYEIEQIQST